MCVRVRVCSLLDSKTFRLAFDAGADADAAAVPVASLPMLAVPDERALLPSPSLGRCLWLRSGSVVNCGCGCVCGCVCLFVCCAVALCSIFQFVPLQQSASRSGRLSPRHIFSALRVPDLNATPPPPPPSSLSSSSPSPPARLPLGSSTNTTHTHQRKRERERLPNETRTQQTRFLLDFIVAVFVVAAELRTTQAESRRSRQNDTHTNKHTEHNIIITITTTKQSGAPLLFRCRRLVVSPRLTDEHVRFVRFVSIRFVLALERTERTEHERVCTACCHCRCRCRCPRRCHCGLTYWL